MPLPLFNLGSSSDGASLLSSVRDTSYISEITSGETSPSESGLWSLLSVVPPSLTPSPDDKAYKDPSALLAFAREKLQGQKTEEGDEYEILALVIADGQTDKDGSFLVAVLKGGDSVADTYRVAAKSVLEVASNLHVANMALSEFRSMSGNAEVYDAGYGSLS